MEWLNLPEYVEQVKKCWKYLWGFSWIISVAGCVVFSLMLVFYDRIESIMGHAPAWIWWGWGISTFLLVGKIINAIIAPIMRRHSQRKEQKEEQQRRREADFRWLDIVMSLPFEDAVNVMDNIPHNYELSNEEIVFYLISHKGQEWAEALIQRLLELSPPHPGLSRLEILAGKQ